MNNIYNGFDYFIIYINNTLVIPSIFLISLMALYNSLKRIRKVVFTVSNISYNKSSRELSFDLNCLNKENIVKISEITCDSVTKFIATSMNSWSITIIANKDSISHSSIKSIVSKKSDVVDLGMMIPVHLSYQIEKFNKLYEIKSKKRSETIAVPVLPSFAEQK